MRYLILILLLGCATPLTEEERLDEEYAEGNRKIMYDLWKSSCLSDEVGGVVFSNNPGSPCGNRRNCIPHKWDWDWDEARERPKIGNSVVCASRRQMEEFMRSMGM